MTLAPGAQHRWAPPRVEAPHVDDLSTVLAGGASWVPVVHSTLDGSDMVQVPVVGGSVAHSVDMEAQVRLAVTVPRFADGFDWHPGNDATHPLARYGQTLSAAVHVTGGGVDVLTQVATAAVQSWDLSADGGSVSVECLGPLKAVKDAGFAVPQSVRPGGTFGTELTRLMAGVAPLVIDDGLVDRALPDRQPLGDDRLEAVKELLTAWPARVRTDAYGVVWVLPPLGDAPSPSVRLADGEGGTVVSAPTRDSREGTPNRVVARGEAESEDRPAVQGVADVRSGPMSVDGPYGTVVEYYSSRLLTVNAQAVAAAKQILRSRRSRRLPVTCAPDPRFTLDMPVEVVHDGRPAWGWVAGWELPLVVGSGAMRVDVEVPS